MKKTYLYSFIAALAFAGVGCNSDDPSDATEKKVYAEGEAPYLRTNNEATVTASRVFSVVDIDAPQYVYLKDYATQFHKFLNMTVDETVAAIERGEVVFYNINTSRQCWDVTPPNNGESGWYYTSNGRVASSDQNPVFTASLNKTEKAIEIHAVNNPAAGTLTTLDMGFAIKNGRDFDDYVRFAISLVVTDPSIVECSGSVPAGDWASWSLDFSKYDAELQAALGLSAKEFIKLYGQCEPEYQWTNFEDDPIQVFLVKNGERVTGEGGLRPKSTTNWMGWWLDKDQNIVGYGDTSYIFLEGAEGVYNFGRHPNVPSGESATIIVDFAVTADLDKHIKFMVNLSFE